MRASDAQGAEIVSLYRQMEPVTQVIFMRFLRAAHEERTVPPDVAFERAKALVDRHRAGGEVTDADLESIGAPPPTT
ncbi:hypothetical protein ACFOHK_06825 [Falsigemmobacter intermedius]|uniref:Uncharacterized protein n=1 Tax=Falsigemmobacter intermedius TaxID=1553448 RepID=A0A3S3VM09_9RHOB|nr:hypothetical protein [Falsigemmobacter intermedius]RWY38745.1 hypothetical protein EP867_15715 [Falsigemmobacter intermedius]